MQKKKEDDVIEVEIIDDDGTPIIEPKSAVEQLTDVKGYNDLVYKINDLEATDEIVYGDGKNYYPDIGRAIWKNVIMSTKPMIARSEKEKDTLLSVYKIIYAFTKTGEYPLMQQLCNYLGVNMDEFLNIISSPKHPDKEAYLWAYNVFDACASMNAIRSNGNANIRMWLDKSREGKMATETKVELAIETEKLKKLTDYGAELDRQLLSSTAIDKEDDE